jgi:RNA polymerase sigma-70 factor (ECF subfamily)
MVKLPLKVTCGFVSGDEESIQEVYYAYRKLLFFIIVSIVKNEEDAKDLLQETFLKAIENRRSIANPKYLEAYLTATARNLAINFAKKSKPDVSYEDLEEVYGEEEKDNAYLQEMNAYLTDKENIIILYRIEYGYSFRAIADLTGIPVSTVVLRYKTALAKAKAHYRGTDHV